MNREYKTEYGLLKITFPSFWTCEDYDGIEYFAEGEGRWLAVTNFDVRNKDAEWDELTVTLRAAFSRENDGYKIAELVTESVYKVSAGMKFEHKFLSLTKAMNETIGHIQGAWTVKNTNPVIGKIIPQGYDRLEEITLELKERVYLIWDL